MLAAGWVGYLSCLLLQGEFQYIAAARAKQSALPWPPGMQAVEARTQERAAEHPASQDLAAQDPAKRDPTAQEVANSGQAAQELANRDQAAQDVAIPDQAEKRTATGEQAAQEVANLDQAAQEPADRDQAAQEAANRDQAAHEAAIPAGRHAHFKDADTEAGQPLKRATMLKLPHLTDSAGSNTLGTFPLTCGDFVSSLESPIHHVPSAVALSTAVADDMHDNLQFCHLQHLREWVCALLTGLSKMRGSPEQPSRETSVTTGQGDTSQHGRDVSSTGAQIPWLHHSCLICAPRIADPTHPGIRGSGRSCGSCERAQLSHAAAPGLAITQFDALQAFQGTTMGRRGQAPRAPSRPPLTPPS